jgi:Ankyrin repeats (3 copies)/Ankyrin repeat
MEDFTSQVDEWKESQQARLPEVELPCRSCQQQLNVQFDPPEKCPNCGTLFLGNPSQRRRIKNILIALGIIVLLVPQAFMFLTGRYAAPPQVAILLENNKALFVFIALIVIIPAVKLLYAGLIGSVSGSLARTRSREKWVRYTNAITGEDRGRISYLAGVGPEALFREAWLHARSLLAPFFVFGEFAFITEHQQPFWQECRLKLPSTIEPLLRDLLWVDGFLRCTCGSWDAARFQSCGSDSPSLIDFVARIKKTAAADLTSTQGVLLLPWIAEQTPATAPLLIQSLAWGEIHVASRDGELGRVKALLQGDPHLISSREGRRGGMPLHLAAASGHKDVMEVLLAHQAEVNAKNAEGETPLHLAAGGGHRELVEVLLAYRAELNAKANGGTTPLHLAAGGGHKEVTELLLARQAEVNAEARFGPATPLVAAVTAGHTNVVEMLLAGGADVKIKANTGYSALQLAGAFGHKEIWELLLAREAGVEAEDGCFNADPAGGRTVTE